MTLTRALPAWRRLLGADSVITDSRELERYETATFTTSQRILAVLRPAHADLVPPLLRIAGRHRVAIYPISRGKNWGYGSRVPVTGGCAVLELSRLQRISAFDEALGYVRVEPGVTFARLAEFLRRRRSRRMVSVPGTTPDASVLANALERGIGFGALANRGDHLCHLEVVLATGERIQTGFGRFPAAPIQSVHRHGIGPALDGLFFQSNLGVVVAATIWLARRPRYATAVEASASIRRLPRMLAVVRRLLADGSLSGVVKVRNRYGAIMGLYPDRPDIQQFIPPPPLHLPTSWVWSARLLLTGDDAPELDARARHVVRALRGAAKAVVSQPRQAASRLRGIEAGCPTPDGLAPLEWRQAAPQVSPRDPGLRGRGAIFCSPVAPLDPDGLSALAQWLESTCLDQGFEPYLTLNVMDERMVQLVLGIFYDRTVAGADRRAMRAYQRCLRGCIARGYYPYRLGIQSMDQIPAARDDTDRVLARIRHALDPMGILSPGRYSGRRGRTS